MFLKICSICYNQAMFYNLKNSFISLLLISILLVSSLAFLTHHSMPSSNNVDLGCRTTCFTESASTQVVAMPEKLNILLIVALPLLMAAVVYFSSNLPGKHNLAYLHNTGPPLYKRFEVYRI